jgi:flavodoxin
MNIVIVYDSNFGNTRAIAEAARDVLAAGNEVRLAAVQEADQLDLTRTDLLIVGSPTRGFRPTPHISSYVGSLDRVAPGKLAAAFDTRLDLDAVKPEPLKWVIDVGGYAASRIAASLERHGFLVRGRLAGFLVESAEGPLKDGEIERVRDWAGNLVR